MILPVNHHVATFTIGVINQQVEEHNWTQTLAVGRTEVEIVVFRIVFDE